MFLMGGEFTGIESQFYRLARTKRKELATAWLDNINKRRVCPCKLKG